jgi:hypothetical protein
MRFERPRDLLKLARIVQRGECGVLDSGRQPHTLLDDALIILQMADHRQHAAIIRPEGRRFRLLGADSVKRFLQWPNSLTQDLYCVIGV